MALTKPILYSVPAFDADEDYLFTFNVIGGDQVVANKLVITNQESGNIVYQTKQITYTLSHELSAEILTNGNYYSAYIITYDAQDNASNNSNTIQFYCYSQPTFEIDNIPESNIITNSSYGFNLHYDQEEGEELNSYLFTLYDSQIIQIATSNTLYVGSQTLPLNLEYIFSGFSNNTVYYIQASGLTSEGTNLKTSLMPFTVQYVSPEVYSIVELSNNCDGGYVLVKSNIIDITGTSSPYPPTYVDNNTAVSVLGNTDYISWTEGYILSEDFTMSLWGRNFTADSRIIRFNNATNDKIEIYYRENTEGDFYADAWITSNAGLTTYYIYSDPISEPTINDKLQIWLRRINGLYSIKLENLE